MPGEGKKISLEVYRNRQQENSAQQEYERPKYPKSRGGKRHKVTREIVEMKRILGLNNNHRLQKEIKEKLEEAKKVRVNIRKQHKTDKKKMPRISTNFVNSPLIPGTNNGDGREPRSSELKINKTQ